MEAKQHVPTATEGIFPLQKCVGLSSGSDVERNDLLLGSFFVLNLSTTVCRNDTNSNFIFMFFANSVQYSVTVKKHLTNKLAH